MADEYIRKQDAIDLINKISNIDLKAKGGICVSLANLQIADVVPVVRCKDCENWQTDWNPSISNRHYCAVMDSMMTAEDFCSYGERREE